MQSKIHDDVAEQLHRIEQMLQLLIQQRTVKEWYTTAEVAHLLDKADTLFANGAVSGEFTRASVNTPEEPTRNGASATMN